MNDAEKAAVIVERRLRNLTFEKNNQIEKFHRKEKQRVKLYKIIHQEVQHHSILKNTHVPPIDSSIPPVNRSTLAEYSCELPAEDNLHIWRNKYYFQSKVSDTIPVNEHKSHEVAMDFHSNDTRSFLPPSVVSESSSVHMQQLLKVAHSLDIRVYPRLAMRQVQSEQPVSELGNDFSSIKAGTSEQIKMLHETLAHQRASSRRAFSEWERRFAHHVRSRKLAQHLKDQREAVRREEEMALTKIMESHEEDKNTASTPDNDENQCDILKKEYLDPEVEKSRYLTALLHQLEEQCNTQNLHIPPLCPCWDSVWQTNPQLCCNNCLFYKNTVGFLSSLYSFIRSMQE